MDPDLLSDPVSPPSRRLVLSSVSDYFAAMFTSDVLEAKQEEVKMEGVDPDALWMLVQYAYTGTNTSPICGSVQPLSFFSRRGRLFVFSAFLFYPGRLEIRAGVAGQGPMRLESRTGQQTVLQPCKPLQICTLSLIAY